MHRPFATPRDFLSAVPLDEGLGDLLFRAGQCRHVSDSRPWNAYDQRKLSALLEEGGPGGRDPCDACPALSRKHQGEGDSAMGEVELVERAQTSARSGGCGDSELGRNYLLRLPAKHAYENRGVVRAQTRAGAIETSDEVNLIACYRMAPGPEPPSREVVPDGSERVFGCRCVDGTQCGAPEGVILITGCGSIERADEGQRTGRRVPRRGVFFGNGNLADRGGHARPLRTYRSTVDPATNA